MANNMLALQAPAGAPFEIKSIPGKGLGLVATRDIPRRTEIWREEGITAPCCSYIERMAMLTLLSDEKKAHFMALHQLCRCEPPCEDKGCKDNELMRIWDTNAWVVDIEGVPPKDPYRPPKSVYLLASRFNHECVPNTAADFNLKSQFIVEARRDIAAGEELTTSYIFGENFPSAAVRREKLSTWGFHCECLTCIQDVLVPKYRHGKVGEGSCGPLPVFGEHTQEEKNAFAGATLWAGQVRDMMKDIIKDTDPGPLLVEGTCDRTHLENVIFEHKNELCLEMLMANDQYELGEEVMKWYAGRWGEAILNQANAEAEDLWAY